MDEINGSVNMGEVFKSLTPWTRKIVWQIAERTIYGAEINTELMVDYIWLMNCDGLDSFQKNAVGAFIHELKRQRKELLQGLADAAAQVLKPEDDNA